MRIEENLYDVVERAAIRQGTLRLDLWILVARAICEGELVVNYACERVDGRGPTFSDWMIGFRNAVEGGEDPNNFGARKILQQIIVTVRKFNVWLANATQPARGPKPEGSGYHEADRKTFSEIASLKKSGKARSVYSAALKLANEGKLAGVGTPQSKAKRVAERYRREGGRSQR